MLEPGTILGERYEIVEKIGAGGMSIVYKARCNKLQRYVAIKVLREEFLKDEAFVKKFRAEAFSAGSLSHPNIVSIYDVGQEGEVPYIVMEYIEGQTLKEFIEKYGPLSSAEVLEYGVQIVSALRHAHKNHIIHRDIKPQNILITGDRILKVADFGIARAVDSSTIVATGNAIGSVHYFSPEQAKGKYVNETSDLYSCGIVMFEMATKRLPFQADSHVSIALKHINEEVPAPSLYNPEMNKALEFIILKATDKKQELRYQNADAMLEDMKAVLADPHIVLTSEVAEQMEGTVLLTDAQTNYIRQNEKPVQRLDTTQASGAKLTGAQDLYDEEEEEEEEVKTSYKVLAGIGGVLAALVLVGILMTVMFFVMPSFSKPQHVVVPDILGQTVEVATQMLKDKNLDIKVVSEESSDKEAGTIIKQSPDKEQITNPGTVVEVIVAKGEEVIATGVMPDLSNMDAADAQRELEQKNLGLRVVLDWVYDEDLERSKVIEHTPTAGDEVKEGDVVTLVVSKGPKVVLTKVPNLYNLTVQEATVSLNDAKLSLGRVTEDFSSTIEVGKIIQQTLLANQEVEEGQVVDVVISKGPEATEEPEGMNPGEEGNIPTDPINPETPSQDGTDEQATLTHVIMAPDSMNDQAHVMVTLTDDNGTRTVYDSVVTKDQLPLPIQIVGKGKGELVTYFDGKEEFRDNNVNFNEVTQQ